MPRLSILVSLACLLGSAAVHAQQVRVFGRLIQEPGGLALQCSQVVIQSSNPAPSSLIGAFVEVEGSRVPGTAVPTVAATRIVGTTDFFELRGDDRIGRTLLLRVQSDIGRTYYLLAALAPGFLPLDGILPVASGTLLLDPSALLLLHAGPLDRSWEEPLPIPRNPSLVGLQIFFQAAILPAQLPFIYLNAQCVTLRAR